MQIDVTQEILDVVRILSVEKQRQILREAEALAREDKTPSIWQKIRSRSEKIPDEVWEEMPTDGSENHNKYLHGKISHK